MKRCINDKETVLLVRNDSEKWDVKELLEHIKVCEKCKKRVEDYRKVLDAYEDYIKYDNWGGS